MLTPHAGKSQYTEIEAAEELGISIDNLRDIVRNHVVEQTEDIQNLPVTTFQPSDLLILRLFAGMSPNPTLRD
jgi:hypothetical protein